MTLRFGKGKSDDEIADLLDIPVERVKEVINKYYDSKSEE